MKTHLQISMLAVVCAPLLGPLAAPVGMIEAAEDAPQKSAIDFARDVLPILSNHCWSCHGPDEASRQAGLRLDVRAQALKPIEGVAPIVPGQPQASELMRRIRADDDDTLMPPPETLKPLSAAQKNILQRWIAAGAPYAGQAVCRTAGASLRTGGRNAQWPAYGAPAAIQRCKMFF